MTPSSPVLQPVGSDPTKTQPTTPSLLSLMETAAILGINRSTAYDLVKRGEFPVPVRHVGKLLKVSRIQLDAYLAGTLPEAG